MSDFLPINEEIISWTSRGEAISVSIKMVFTSVMYCRGVPLLGGIFVFKFPPTLEKY